MAYDPPKKPAGQSHARYETMTSTPGIHHRRSIRLRGYDYASAGAYFVTGKECLFGRIEGEVMVVKGSLPSWFRRGRGW